MNAVLKYPGAKWSIANWIIDFFPELIAISRVSSKKREILLDEFRASSTNGVMRLRKKGCLICQNN